MSVMCLSDGSQWPANYIRISEEEEEECHFAIMCMSLRLQVWLILAFYV